MFIRRHWLAVVFGVLSALAPAGWGQEADTRQEFYYDLDSLNPSERARAQALKPGDVLVEYPGDTDIATGRKAEELVRSNRVRVMVMAGVGSSAIGTAALAKQVAKAVGEPVAGIVTGMGAETLNARSMQTFWVTRPANFWGFSYAEPASDTLYRLYMEGAKPELLVGYSRGSMDISNTLFKLRQEGKEAAYEGTRFLSVGIGVRAPSGLAKFRQYIGTYDWTGIWSSVSFENVRWVLNRQHHLNPNRPSCMNLCEYVRDIYGKTPAITDGQAMRSGRGTVAKIRGEIAGAGRFGAAYAIKELAVAAETLDGERAVQGIRAMATPEFLKSTAAFMGAARASEHALKLRGTDKRLASRRGGKLLMQALPLAVGMVAAEALTGHVDPATVAVSTGAYLGAGAAINSVADRALMAALKGTKLRGPAMAVYEIGKLAGVLYVGEKADHAMRTALGLEASR